MPVERFIWTTHAEDRRVEHMLDRLAIELAIRSGHAERRVNPGEADWRIHGLMVDGRRFVAVYDHPHHGDHGAVRIVSVWDL
jgi:hypothetical protein